MYNKQHILYVSVFVHGFCSYLLTKHLLCPSMKCPKMMGTLVSKKMMYLCPSVSFPQNFTVVTHWRWTWFTLTIKESWTLMAAYPGRSWPLVLKHSPVIVCRNGIVNNPNNVHSVWPRKRETSCLSPDLRLRRRPSSPPSWQLSSLQCVTMQRRLGEVTSTSLCLTQTDLAQSTHFTCFLHSFRYHISIVS